MKASLQLNMSQQLTLTPQLQQAIRLLQLSTIDLNQEIQQALESNPMLEVSSTDNKKESKETQSEILMSDQWIDNSSYRSKKNSDFDYNYEHFHGTTTNLSDHLRWQLGLSHMSDIDTLIAESIIDATNDDGFLSLSLEELLESVTSEQSPIELDELEAVRHRIQRFDPIGCASLNLKETLLIQLEQYDQSQPLMDITKSVIEQSLELLGQHNYRQILKNQKISEEQLRDVILIIQNLNPKPGNKIESTRAEYVIPDVTVKKINDTWVTYLNNEMIPKLRINNNYASLIQRANNSSDNIFLKNNLQEARWFLKSIQSRQETLLKVAKCIVEYQKDFLEYGEEAMKPLVLNDIALALDMHESTISRVTTQKYIHTPRGVFELKYFFSSHVNTTSGGECSSTAIRAVIKKLIASENPKKPLSDSKIAQLIGDQGIKVARRTVAKYREAMGIPPSNERKSIIR